MNTSSEVTLAWADGIYTFALKLKQIDELQRTVAASLGTSLAAVYGIGLGDIAERLNTGRFLAADVIETLRLGLIGGGLPAARAGQLIEAYCDGQSFARPDDPSSPLAMARVVAGAAMFGLDEVTSEGDAGNSQAPATGGSTSEPSTGKDSPSGSAPERSDD